MTYEDNILYVDVATLEHKMSLYNNTPKIRLYLGRIREDEFEVTVDTIKHLPEDEQLRLRVFIKSIFDI